MIILVATCSIYGKIRVRTLLITEQESFDMYFWQNGVQKMNRKEFLEILRSQLAGQMQEGKAAAHIRYYEDYIQSQVRGGRSEQEVLQELGDPHLIAKTLIDTDDGSTQEDYGEYSSYGSSYGNETELPHQQEKRWKKVIDLSTWHGRAVVIAAAAVIIILLILIIGVAIPFFIILAIILYFLSWLKKRNDQ